MSNALGSLAQRAVADEQIGHQVDQQQLPCGQLAVLLDDDGRDEQHDGDANQRQLSLQVAMMFMMMFVMMLVAVATVLLMSMMFVMLMMLVVLMSAALVLSVFVMMCHNAIFLNS